MGSKIIDRESFAIEEEENRGKKKIEDEKYAVSTGSGDNKGGKEEAEGMIEDEAFTTKVKEKRKIEEKDCLERTSKETVEENEELRIIDRECFAREREEEKNRGKKKIDDEKYAASTGSGDNKGGKEEAEGMIEDEAFTTKVKEKRKIEEK